jgi:hypothetical protein
MKLSERLDLHKRIGMYSEFVSIPLYTFKNESPAWALLESFLAKYKALNLSFKDGVFVAGGSLVRAILEMQTTADIDLWVMGPLTQYRAEQVLRNTDPGLIVTDDNQQYAPTYYMSSGINVQLCEMPADWNVYDTLYSFDLFNSMVATDGETVIFHLATLHALRYMLLNINHNNGRPNDPEIQKARVEKYRAMGFKVMNVLTGVPE